MRGKSGSGPFSKYKKGQDYAGMLVRVHKNDYERLKSRLLSEDMTIQDFGRALIEGLLSGDPQVIRIIADWKKRNEGPSKKERDVYSLSPMERRKLQEALQSANGSDDDGEAV